MKDVMVDIESFGNGKDACIVQIGACYFDRKTGEIGRKFKVNIDAQSSVESGAMMDAPTVYWWLSQSKEAINSIISEPKQSITQAFSEFNAFVSDAECIWSHATFDFVIIMETFKRLGIIPSFSFRSARDIRTLLDLANTKPNKDRKGIHHDGLDDAIYQVGYCVEALILLEKA